MMAGRTTFWLLRALFRSWPVVLAAVFSVALLIGMLASRSEAPVVEPPIEWLDLIESGQPAPAGRVSLGAIRR